MNYPREFPTELPYPFKSEGQTPFFPPVCLQSHNDPTQILNHILPQINGSIPLPLGPRPWTKICMNYVNSTENAEAPRIDADIVFPPGGSTNLAEPKRYLDGVGHESQLRRLDQRLRKCDAGSYRPNDNGDMFNSRLLVPHRPHASSSISEATFPKVLMTMGEYDCRAEADKYNLSRSTKMFANATKQDRIKNY